MTKNNKIFLAIIIALAVFPLFILLRGNEDTWICSNGEWVKHGNPSSVKPETVCGTSVDLNAVNFDETGHFVKDNPGMKPGVWFLVYEKPGMPALYKELVFDEKSICEYNETVGKCPDVLLPSSAMTRVRGIEQNNIVRVVNAVSGSIEQI
jgi:hypothetical protein